MKTVLHISDDDTRKVSELLGNIRNLREDSSVDNEATVVLMNGDAVNTALGDSEAAEFFREELENMVSFRVCSNSLEGRDIEPEDLLQGIEVVESGVGKIKKLQSEGFNYIRL